MTEILTESFCERCGTRYTFQTAAPGRRRMKRLKVLSKGLRNYVLSDETSLEEALADARGDEERAVSSGQLDAFHQTFNFCMSCRQYTCANCWNGHDNRCLTCAPDLSHEVMPAAFPDLDPMAGLASFDAGATPPVNEDRGALLEASAWPEADRPQEAAAAATIEIAADTFVEAAGQEPGPAEPLPWGLPPTATPGGAPVAPADPTPAPTQPVIPGPTQAASPAESPDERAAAAAAQTAALLARFRPDRKLDEALAAYEQGAGPAEAVTVPEAPEAPAPPTVTPEVPPDAAAAAAESAAADSAAPAPPTPGVIPTPVPDASVAEPAPPAVAAEVEEPAPPAVAAEVAEPAAAPAPERRDDRVEIPTWRIVAPDSGAPEPSPVPPAIAPSTKPSAPAETSWPPQASASDPSDGNAPQWPAAPFLATPSAARAADALWAASSLEVVEKAGGGVQSCVSCGLPLSATARFCRRCGSRQG